MGAQTFAPLAVVQLPSPCRLNYSSCSPDKDLVALVSRLGSKSRLSLWKLQGSKKWEVDVGFDQSRNSEIVGLTWSPSGQSIAVAYDPPRITVHSVQDGCEKRSLSIQSPSHTSPRRAHRLANIWWFQKEKAKTASPIPDIFGRNNVITGSAHSILAMLPLLDHLADEAQKTTATDMFAFQGSHTRSNTKITLPEPIEIWPILHADTLAASMSSALEGLFQSNDSGNSIEDPDIDTFLVAADDQSHSWYFLDGSYPLGPIALSSGSDLSLASLSLDPSRSAFYAHLRVRTPTCDFTDLRPTIIHLPLLETRSVRDMGRLSSTARELIWYTMRVVRDMRVAWFGSDTLGGAREIGPKWIRALETRQKEKFGLNDSSPVLDLTSLLVTGRGSDALTDFLGSGEQMSERGLSKWESSMVEALIKLRDYSEKRVAPACQRLHIVLEEIHGWSQLPQYGVFELAGEEIKTCIALTSNAIVIASWLASMARRELTRFREFIKWLSFETAVVSATETRPQPRHDILEVNNYLMSGLVVSPIDKWFLGPVPRFTPRDLGVRGGEESLSTVLQQARHAINDPAQTAWRANVKHNDLSHLDRNLDALVQELASLCQRVFSRAASATTRSRAVNIRQDSYISQASTSSPLPPDQFAVRERIVIGNGKGDEVKQRSQFLVMKAASSEHRTFLCFAQMGYEETAAVNDQALEQIAIAVFRCCVPPEGGCDPTANQTMFQEDFDLLEFEFFDDEYIVIVYRLRREGGPAFLATVKYNDVEYQSLSSGHPKIRYREDLMHHAMDLLQKGQVPSVSIPIKRYQALTSCRVGEVCLAVNGRAGRRVACVLDHKGTTLEVLDLEAEGGDEGEGDREGDGEER